MKRNNCKCKSPIKGKGSGIPPQCIDKHCSVKTQFQVPWHILLMGLQNEICSIIIARNFVYFYIIMNATIIIYTYMATCTLVHGPLTFLNRKAYEKDMWDLIGRFIPMHWEAVWGAAPFWSMLYHTECAYYCTSLCRCRYRPTACIMQNAAQHHF